jgi:hypothetical protein
VRKEMTVEEKVAIVREAIEQGAEVNLSFHGVISLQKGEEIINRMAELTGAKVSHSEQNNILRFEVLTGPKGLDATVFYEPSKEDYKANLLKQLAEIQKEIEKEGEATA